MAKEDYYDDEGLLRNRGLDRVNDIVDSVHVCRESQNPRMKGTCACGKKMPVQGFIKRPGEDVKPIPYDKRTAPMREFESGATRDGDKDKLDYEGFLSPLVVREYANYMHKHRVQSDGTVRDSDNWQKGIPLDQYMKSAWRHFMEVWEIHRNPGRGDLRPALREALCALLFNVMGYLHEELRNHHTHPIDEDPGMGYE